MNHRVYFRTDYQLSARAAIEELYLGLQAIFSELLRRESAPLQMQEAGFPLLEQQKAWRTLNPAGALELDLATLHTRAKDYLPNVSKAELRSTLGPGPFTLEQLQQLLSKRSEQGQGRDFQQQYATYLSAKAGKGSAADAVARQLEGWQDIGTVSKEDREAVRNYISNLAAAATVPSSIEQGAT